MISIQLQQLKFSYEPRLGNLWQEFSFVIPAAQVTGVIGPNGSGKSTLLKLISGELKPSSGEVQLIENDRQIDILNLKHRARLLSYLPQFNSPAFPMTLQEIVELGRYPYTGFIKSKLSKFDLNIVADCLNIVGLHDKADRLSHQVSGGELQRTMLAQLLATQSEILLMDEPVTSLDISHALGFLELCQQLPARQKTILMSLHQLEWAWQYCDNILILPGDGQKALFGKTKDVLTSDNIYKIFEVHARFYKSSMSLSKSPVKFD